MSWRHGLAAALAIAACSKADDKSAGGSGGAAGATPRDAVVEAWRAGKLAPSEMTPATVAFGKDCQAGSVNGVDALVCNFGSPAEAKAAEQPGLGWIGSATGASQAHGSALIVVADRKKADVNGKTINQLLKLAPN